MNDTEEKQLRERLFKQYVAGKTADWFDGRKTTEVWGEYCLSVTGHDCAPMHKKDFVAKINRLFCMETVGSRKYRQTRFNKIGRV